MFMRSFLSVLALVAIASLASAGVRVVDGDTIEVDGTMVRVHGIDAPEYGQSCSRANGKKWPCGREATAAMAHLVEGKDLLCDEIVTDKYGRSIATCHANGQDIGRELVRTGNAWAFVRFSDAYVSDEAAAQRDQIGIWQGPAIPPWEYRSHAWVRAEDKLPADAPDGCVIKGNISQHGMIYHTPWSPWYSRTKISPHKGERWFCDEAEAVAAGWRAPYWW
jgi:endonuclease YncB( thermonuclease family)